MLEFVYLDRSFTFACAALRADIQRSGVRDFSTRASRRRQKQAVAEPCSRDDRSRRNEHEGALVSNVKQILRKQCISLYRFIVWVLV